VSEIALRLKCSVEADVTTAYAWQFRSDISNWNDPPARFTLDGPFEAGAYGATEIPGQAPLRWQITEVRPGTSFVIEMQLDRAMLVFEWRFDESPEGKTILTQEIVLSGENAAMYAPQVEAGFGSNLEAGMKRIAAEMAAAKRHANNLTT
jgi:Polyketide cyclase / dehydrase and lipid transport